MTNALHLGQIVFFGARKGVVIERTGSQVTVCWFDRDVQRIQENVPAYVLTLIARNVRRKLGQSARAAILTHVISCMIATVQDSKPVPALPVDRGSVFAGVLALVVPLVTYLAFWLNIGAAWFM